MLFLTFNHLTPNNNNFLQDHSIFHMYITLIYEDFYFLKPHGTQTITFSLKFLSCSVW